MKKILLISLFLLSSIMSFAHDISFLGCVDGKLKFKVTNGPSGGFVSVKIVDNSNNVVTCATTAPFYKNTTGTSVTFEVNQNPLSCKTFTKVYVKWSKDNYVNTYKVEAKDYCKEALPIKLKSFEGQRDESNVAFNWTYSDESNFSHFVLEGSKDLKEWFSLKETNKETLAVVNTELDYFRLKMIDLDGTYSYSKSVFVENSPIKEISYLNMAGLKVENPSGVVLQKKEYFNGKVTYKKLIK